MTAFQDECSRDLEVAEPIIKEAEAALNSLDKASLGELKSFGSPAAEVVNVVSACMVLTSPGGKIPKVALLSFPKLHRLQISFCCLAKIHAIQFINQNPSNPGHLMVMRLVFGLRLNTRQIMRRRSNDKGKYTRIEVMYFFVEQDISWAAGKKFMGNVDAFLKKLLTFNKDAIPLPCVEKVEKDFLSNPAFNADNIRTKSGAAAGLCGWVINICKYFRIYQVRKFMRIGESN